MELIIALIVARFIVNGTIDITSMITGNQPPSKTYHDAKGDNAEDGPLTRAIKAWWADAIDDLDEKRKIKRLETKEEKEAERKRRKDERQRWIDEMNERIEDEKARQEEEKRAREKPWVPPEESPDPHDETEERPAEEKPEELPPVEDEEVEDDTEESEERPQDRQEELPPVDERVDGTVDPEQPADPEDTEEEIFDADIVEDPPEGPEGPEIPDLKVISGGREADDEWSTYRTKPQLYAVREDGEGMTNIIPSTNGASSPRDPDGGRGQAKVEAVRELVDKNQTAGGTNVTTMYEGKDQQGSATYTSGGSGSAGTSPAVIEGGISAHIKWTADMAAYQNRASSHVEIVGAEMFRSDNGPERLAKIAHIQELHRQLRMAYLDVSAILVHDKQLIGEAYAATRNQAGDKKYTTS